MKKLNAILLLLSCVQFGSIYCMDDNESDWVRLPGGAPAPSAKSSIEEISHDWVRVPTEEQKAVQVLSQQGAFIGTGDESEDDKKRIVVMTKNAVTLPKIAITPELLAKNPMAVKKQKTYGNEKSYTTDQIALELLSANNRPLKKAMFTYKPDLEGGSTYVAYDISAGQTQGTRLDDMQAESTFAELEKLFHSAYAKPKNRLSDLEMNWNRSGDNLEVAIVPTSEGLEYIRKYYAGKELPTEILKELAPDYTDYISRQELPDGSVKYTRFSYEKVTGKHYPHYADQQVAIKKKSDESVAYQVSGTIPETMLAESLFDYIKLQQQQTNAKKTVAVQQLQKLNELSALINEIKTTEDRSTLTNQKLNKLHELLAHLITLKIDHQPEILQNPYPPEKKMVAEKITHTSDSMSKLVLQPSNATPEQAKLKIQALNSLSNLLIQRGFEEPKTVSTRQEPNEIKNEIRKLEQSSETKFLDENLIDAAVTYIFSIQGRKPRVAFNLMSPLLIDLETRKLEAQATNSELLLDAIQKEIMKLNAIISDDPQEKMQDLETKAKIYENIYFQKISDAEVLFKRLEAEFNAARAAGKMIM